MGDESGTSVHTYSGFENKAKKSLEEKIRLEGLQEQFGEILIPMEQVVEMVKGEKKTSKRKFFPGYIFVQMEMNDRTWHLVKNTPKVTGFAGRARRTSSPAHLRQPRWRGSPRQISEGTAQAQAQGAVRGRRHRARDRRAVRELQRHRGRGQPGEGPPQGAGVDLRPRHPGGAGLHAGGEDHRLAVAISPRAFAGAGATRWEGRRQRPA